MEVAEDRRVGSVFDRLGSQVGRLERGGDDPRPLRAGRLLTAADEENLWTPPHALLGLLDLIQLGPDPVEGAIDTGHSPKLPVDDDRKRLLDHQLAFVIVGLGDHVLVDLAGVEEPLAAALVIQTVEADERFEEEARGVGAVAVPVGQEAAAVPEGLGGHRRRRAARAGRRGLGVSAVGIGLIAEVRARELGARLEHVAGKAERVGPAREQAVFGGHRHHPRRRDRLGGVAFDGGCDRLHAIEQDLLPELEHQCPHPQEVEHQHGREDGRRGRNGQQEKAGPQAEGRKKRHGMTSTRVGTLES